MSTHGASIDRLAEAQKATRWELGSLRDLLGVSVEEKAGGVLRAILSKQGYHIVKPPFQIRINGDVDVVLQVRDPNEQEVWAVLEAKVRLSYQAVEAWSNRIRSSGFQKSLRKAGISGPYLVYAYGMRMDAGTNLVTEEFGVGLLSSEGEQPPPADLISD